MISNAWEFFLTASIFLLFGGILWRKHRVKWGGGLLLAGVLLTLVALYFFRDPHRHIPLKPGMVVSPADGRVVAVDDSVSVPWDAGFKQRISIYLSLFDVHVNRIPVSGVISFKKSYAGGYYPAFSESAEKKNVATVLGIDTPGGLFYVKQMTGLLARRIVCRPNLGDTVQQGARYGLIKLGSRVDCYLPQYYTPIVKPGDRLKAGESLIAYD